METNIVEVFEKFRELEATEMTKACRRALRAGAKALQTQTIANFNALGLKKTGSGKYSDNLVDAIRIKKFSNEYDEELSTGVHIMGTRAKTSGTYRTRFFEKGTADRYQDNIRGTQLKKPRYIGRIHATNFFKAANDAVLPQLEGIYATEIDKACDKINSSK